MAKITIKTKRKVFYILLLNKFIRYYVYIHFKFGYCIYIRLTGNYINKYIFFKDENMENKIFTISLKSSNLIGKLYI